MQTLQHCVCVAAIATLVLSGGCQTMSVQQQLTNRADGIEARLLQAQAMAAKLPPTERDAKLAQLDKLRQALGVANLARDNARNVPNSSARDALYSVTREAYGMIEWRIDMPPGPEDDRLKELRLNYDGQQDSATVKFGDGRFDIDTAQPSASGVGK